MQQVLISIDDRLANPGDCYPVAGHLDEAGYTLGDHEFTLPGGIDYDVMLTNAGEGILASGILRAHVVGTCDRCLEDAEFDVSSEVDEYYLFEEPTDEASQEAEDDLEFSLVVDSTIDLADAFLSALVMETPYVVLCQPDCLGLCPVCGANLNTEDCGHASQIEAERAAKSPFAVLKDLDLGDSAQNDDKA